MQIEANGHTAFVDGFNRLNVVSSTRHDAAFMAAKGYAFTAPFSETPGGAGDVFAYLGATGTYPLWVVGIDLQCAAAETFTIRTHAAGLTSGNTAATISPSYRGLNAVGGTVGDFEIGTNIVIADGAPVIQGYGSVTAAKGIDHVAPPEGFWIPVGSALSIAAVGGSSVVLGVIHFVTWFPNP